MRAGVRLLGLASVVSSLGLGQPVAFANDPHCEGKAGFFSFSCADPASNEVVVYADVNAGGKCMRFSSDFVDPANAPGSSPGSIPSLSVYGFNDCISSVKVGSDVRLLAYKDDKFNDNPADTFAFRRKGGVYRTLTDAHNLIWKMATYEPNAPPFIGSPWNAEQTINDDFSSLIIQRIDQTNKERIPTHFVGSDPTSDDVAFWKQEPQGLCHNHTHWFLAQEVDLGNSPTNPASFQCVIDGGLTGRIWKIPRDVDLRVGSPPPGSSHKDLGNIPAPFNTQGGYRHFGDPDCQTIAGKDYVFIPVQGCSANSGRETIPYVLVLDSDLNFVAAWTIPVQPSNLDVTSLATCMGISVDPNTYERVIGSNHGMGSWVAVRPNPSTPTAVEVWMDTDICNGQGMQVFTADLTKQGAVAMKFKLPAPIIRDVKGLPDFFPAGQGGVFSPSGQTLYLATGDGNNIGGVRVIVPDTGLEITQSGNDYGSFNFQHSLTFTCFPTVDCPTGEEPEGIDFLDTRCSGTPVTSTGRSGGSSQLHVVVNHNGLNDNGTIFSVGDQVEVRHYSVGDNELAPMCDGAPATTGVSSCLQGWRGTTCGEQCNAQTQSDRQTCQTYLDCYFNNGCAPSSSCATQDGVCGVNRLLGGTAGQTIANQVYQCLHCP